MKTHSLDLPHSKRYQPPSADAEFSFVPLPEDVGTRALHDVARLDHAAARHISTIASRCQKNTPRRMAGQTRTMLQVIENESPEIAQEATAILKASPPLQALLETHLAQMEGYSPETHSHSLRVTSLAARAAKPLMEATADEKVSAKEAAAFCIAATLHDYGKILVPDEILHYPGKLIEAHQTRPMRRHAEYSTAMIEATLHPTKPEHQLMRDIIADHHESMNGMGGYPLGRSIENDHVLSRLLPLVDRYDAMTADRSYRKGMGHAQAISEMKDEANVGIIDAKQLERCETMFKDWLQEQQSQVAKPPSPQWARRTNTEQMSWNR